MSNAQWMTHVSTGVCSLLRNRNYQVRNLYTSVRKQKKNERLIFCQRHEVLLWKHPKTTYVRDTKSDMVLSCAEKEGRVIGDSSEKQLKENGKSRVDSCCHIKTYANLAD